MKVTSGTFALTITINTEPEPHFHSSSGLQP
jgi:hypothetical protein